MLEFAPAPFSQACVQSWQSALAACCRRTRISPSPLCWWDTRRVYPLGACQRLSWIFPCLQLRTTSPSVTARAAAVASVRAAMTDRVSALDPVLRSVLGDFLRLLSDTDHSARHAAVLLLSAVVHHKLPLVWHLFVLVFIPVLGSRACSTPAQVRDRLPQLLPLLYTQTEVVEQLVRIIDLGPFKVSVDDGLDLRKSAYECLDTLLEAAPSAVRAALRCTSLR